MIVQQTLLMRSRLSSPISYFKTTGFIDHFKKILELVLNFFWKYSTGTIFVGLTWVLWVQSPLSLNTREHSLTGIDYSRHMKKLHINSSPRLHSSFIKHIQYNVCCNPRAWQSPVFSDCAYLVSFGLEQAFHFSAGFYNLKLS